MKKIIYVLIAVAVAAVSCTKEDESVISPKEGEGTAQEEVNIARYVTFSASTPLTKVALDGQGDGQHNAAWEATDYNKVMLVWNDNGTAKTVRSTAISIDGGNTSQATITFGIPEEDVTSYDTATELYAVYPYAKLNNNVSFVDGKLAVVFKNTQNAGTSFSDAAWYAAKTTKSVNLFTFHPISMVIQFTLNGSKLTNANRVYIRTVNGDMHRLYGKAAITFNDGEGYPLTMAPVLSEGKSDGAGNVTYIPKVGSTHGTGTFYVPIPGYGTNYTYETGKTSPGQAENGFIIQIRNREEGKSSDDYPIPAAYYAAQITQTAGKIYKITNPVENKVYDNYYVAREPKGTGDGLSEENAATLANLKTNVPAFKYSGNIAGALLLNGVTINYLGDETAYSDPIGVFNTNGSAPAHSYSIVGGVGGGTTTFTTTSSATFNAAKATVNIRDITFSGCSTAAAVSVSNGNINFTDVSFTGCEAKALDVSGGTVMVTGGGFSNCTTYEAVNVSAGTLKLYGTTMSGNTARAMYITGGTIVAGDNTDVDPVVPCQFTGNDKTEDSPSESSKHGGVLFISGGSSTDASFSNCTFDNNSNADNDGGVILTTDASTKASFISCTFTRNSAKDGGVALTEGGSVQFNDCTFGGSNDEKNTATSWGAVFYNTSAPELELTVDGGEISYNSATNGSVLRTSQACTVTFKDVNILNNKATGGNGVINNSAAAIRFSGCTVSGNTSTGNGAVVNMSGGSLKADNTNFISNSSKVGKGGTGAVLYCSQDVTGSLYFTNCRFISNTGKNNGAIIHLAAAAGDNAANRVFALNNCLFYGNSGTTDGNNGTINANAANLIILNSTLIDGTMNCVIRTGTPTTYGSDHILIANNIISSETTGGYSFNPCNTSYLIKTSGYNQYSAYNTDIASFTGYTMSDNDNKILTTLPTFTYTAPAAENDYTWSWTNSATTDKMVSAATLEGLMKGTPEATFLTWLKSIEYPKGNAWEVDLYGTKRTSSAYWPGCYQND